MSDYARPDGDDCAVTEIMDSFEIKGRNDCKKPSTTIFCV